MALAPVVQAAHQADHRHPFRQPQFLAYRLPGAGRVNGGDIHPVHHYSDFRRVQTQFLQEIVFNSLGNRQTQVGKPPQDPADEAALAAEPGEAVPVVDNDGHLHQRRGQAGIIPRDIAVDVQQVHPAAIDDPAELKDETEPDPAVEPRHPEVDGGYMGRHDPLGIRGQQAADYPETVRVKARRRLHQHHFGPGAPLRFDDEQDGNFFRLALHLDDYLPQRPRGYKERDQGPGVRGQFFSGPKPGTSLYRRSLMSWAASWDPRVLRCTTS